MYPVATQLICSITSIVTIGYITLLRGNLGLAVHGSVQNLFRVGRHHLRAANHRLLRARAFAEWKEVTCVC